MKIYNKKNRAKQIKKLETQVHKNQIHAISKEGNFFVSKPNQTWPRDDTSSRLLNFFAFHPGRTSIMISPRTQSLKIYVLHLGWKTQRLVSGFHFFLQFCLRLLEGIWEIEKIELPEIGHQFSRSIRTVGNRWSISPLINRLNRLNRFDSIDDHLSG